MRRVDAASSGVLHARARAVASQISLITRPGVSVDLSGHRFGMIRQSPRMLFELDQTDDTQRARDLGPGEATVRIGLAAAVPAVLRSLGADPAEVVAEAGLYPELLDDPDNLISYAALHLRRRSRRRFFALRRCRRLPQPRQLSSIRSLRHTALDPAGACVADTCQTAICEFSYAPLGIRGSVAVRTARI